MYSTLQKLIKPTKKAYPVLPLLLLWILSTIKKKKKQKIAVIFITLRYQ